MPHYNQHAPYIAGNEWVPIHSGGITQVPSQERGTTFRLDLTTTVVSGGVYVPGNIDLGFYSNPVYGMNVYPRGLEAATGPIQQTVYAVNGGSTEGDASVVGCGGTVQSALQSNSNCGVNLPIADPNTDQAAVYVNFDTAARTELLNQRILRVEVLYWATVADPVEDAPSSNPGNIFLSTNSGANLKLIGQIQGSIAGQSELAVIDLGEMNSDYPEDAGSDLYVPWTGTQLARFSSSTGSSSRISVKFEAVARSAVLFYALLRVTHCTERRVAFGGRLIRDVGPGTKIIKLAAPTLTGSVTLAPGEYTVTANLMQTPGSTSVYPSAPLAYARQLYEIPDHEGVIVMRSFTPGETFSRETTNDMQQLSLHTSALALTGVHGYGARLAAPVHASQVAAQDIAQPTIPVTGVGAIDMAQVRFYVRRAPDTTKSLNFSPNGQTFPRATLTPSQWDELPEIWDGWKEVTLRLSTAQPFQVTGGYQVWTWSATGQDPGSPWEILMSDAYSARPFDPPVLDPYQITDATYGLRYMRGWHGFWDDFVDASVTFSTDPDIPTGLAVTQEEQALAGVDPECPGVDDTCIPTSLYYHHITWDASGFIDTFDIDQTDSWGPDWNIVAGAAADYDVTGGYGTVALPVADTSHFVLGSTVMTNVDLKTTFRYNQALSGAELRVSFIFRFIDTNNYYEARLIGATNAVAQIGIFKVVNGTATFIGGSSDTTVSGISILSNEDYGLHIESIGNVTRMNVWRKSIQDEPESWLLTVVDNVNPWPGTAGLRIRTAAGNTNVGLVVSVDDYTASNLDSGGYELQRQDDVDTDWQTIMKSASSHVSEFFDYEARVGVESRYRIRTANALDFWSDWSATEANTLSAPGVDVPGDGNSTLIFTTNFNQDGLQNLAYVMTWSRDVEEPFAFAEADEVSFSRLYGRDFALMGHPTERGSEQFTRNIIVQQAAIPIPSLGNFRALRDMAWNAAPYVCVRDELGNRWLAAVVVPDGVVSRNRRLYIAGITVTEVTNVPAIIDPEA